MEGRKDTVNPDTSGLSSSPLEITIIEVTFPCPIGILYLVQYR